MLKNKTLNNQSPQKLLTRKEVADYFSVSKRTISRWEDEHKLQPIIINARVFRYKLSDVERLLTL